MFLLSSLLQDARGNHRLNSVDYIEFESEFLGHKYNCHLFLSINGGISAKEASCEALSRRRKLSGLRWIDVQETPQCGAISLLRSVEGSRREDAFDMVTQHEFNCALTEYSAASVKKRELELEPVSSGGNEPARKELI
jgi:hypothetical protein